MKQIKKRLCFLMLALLLLVPSGTAYAEEEGGERDKTLAPYFYVEGADGTTDSFPLKETDVAVTINGVIADTYVTQTYANEGDTPINASYVFPASTKVSVHGMKMTIGDKVVTAKIKEKEEAKVEFEEAKSEGKSASLLEQQRPNVFNMNVANIMPGDTVHIELHYTELIVSAEGIYQFVFPTVAGPRYVSPSDDTGGASDDWVAAPYLKEGAAPADTYNITVNISTGVPITSLTCGTHKVKVDKSNESTARVTLDNPADYAGNRDYILEYKLTGQELSSGLMLSKDETENFFMLMVQPPERFKSEDIPSREYIFVLDVSGSMYGFPLDTAKELIRSLVGNLRETDTFNIILFSGAFDQMSATSLPATEKNVRGAIQYVENENGGGGTELAPALERAIAIPAAGSTARSIVVVTDGYIYGEKEIFEIISDNLGTTSFFSFGIGSSVNRYLIEGIAKAGQGESFVVTDPNEAADTAERFRSYIQSPLLTDVKVTYDGFQTYDIEPINIPTLYAEKPIVLFGKWRGEAAGTIRITGKTGTQDYVQEIPVSGVEPLEAGSALRYLWARTKVERLTDYGNNTGSEEIIKKQVTELGLNYTMMTPYTSFIAVIETVRNPDKDSTDVNQPLPLPLGVSNLAIGGYTSGSEPGMIILAVGMALLTAAGVSGRARKRKSM